MHKTMLGHIQSAILTHPDAMSESSPMNGQCGVIGLCEIKKITGQRFPRSILEKMADFISGEYNSGIPTDNL